MSVTTPVFDFVTRYTTKKTVRLHMPGHKGQPFLGCEERDLTEVCGADALFEAGGILLESEHNAAQLFNTGDTLYSTEGSSLSIRTMLCLAQQLALKAGKTSRTVVAARNAHKAFIYAAALLDLEVIWLYPDDNSTQSLCTCAVTAESLERTLSALPESPLAVYVTSPDYLGNLQNLRALSQVAHSYQTLFLVDNAHGSYLHFLRPALHPMDFGADLCTDSAHKTLPVLTGGGYLHIRPGLPYYDRTLAKNAMALFGSTSPSYLILQSLDLCNRYLDDNYAENLAAFIRKLNTLKEGLAQKGWQILPSDPLKLTIICPDGLTGEDLANQLRRENIECEYAELHYLVLMLTPENTDTDLARLKNALGENNRSYTEREPEPLLKPEKVCSLREAIFAAQEIIPTEKALGRVSALPTVACPPAIPIVMAGERIDEAARQMLLRYGVQEVAVIRSK